MAVEQPSTTTVCVDVWRFGAAAGGGERLCRVEFEPEVFTVKSLKASIAAEAGIPCHRQCLVPVGCTEVIDGKGGLLRDACELEAGVQLVVIDVEELRDERLRLPFDDPHRPGLDTVSGWSGEFRAEEQMRTVVVQGRCGIDFTGYCTLRLPKPVELPASWTISFWTLAPIADGRVWRNLVDGVRPDTCIAVCFQDGRLGDYAAQRWLGNFHVSSLAEGWHHFAVVGAEGSTSYYLDGEFLGALPVQTCDTVGAVGNRADGEVREAFGVVSDLRIFGAAASPLQVQELFSQRPRQRDARRDLLELTLML